MSECAGVSEEAITVAHRRLDDAWQRGFVGKITIHFGLHGEITLETNAFEKLPGERRQDERRNAPRDGEERRKP